MMKLCRATLKYLHDSVQYPNTQRRQLKTRIAHIGFGAFHRAHQALLTAKLAAEHRSDWGYCEISLMSNEEKILQLQQQDHLFSVSELSEKGSHCWIVDIVRSALHANIDGIEAILSALSQPDIAIVSLTVTEKGYCYNTNSKKLDETHPLILHDLQYPNSPHSLPGVLLAALRRRYIKRLNGFSILSCDNLPKNGQIIQTVITQLAAKQDPLFAHWISKNVTCPSTMVDRIVPSTSPETLQKINYSMGVVDNLAVVCEPYFRWVIEDNFIAGRPEWEKVGVEFVADVLPHEEMKLRMLNGSHSFLAYLGYLQGYQYIDECIQDPNLAEAAHQFMLQEQAPTLSISNVNFHAYANTLIARYRNPQIKHSTWQIAMDGSQKLPARWLESVRWHLQHNSRFDFLSLAIAAWIRYVIGIDEQQQPINVIDPLLPFIKQRLSTHNNAEDCVYAILSIEAIFGNDLSRSERFITAITQAYLLLIEQGVKQTVRNYLRYQ